MLNASTTLGREVETGVVNASQEQRKSQDL